jgi:hypothetical protein
VTEASIDERAGIHVASGGGRADLSGEHSDVESDSMG